MTIAVYDLSCRPITFDALCFAASVGSTADRPKFVVLADRRRVKTQKDLEITEGEWLWRAHRVVAASMWMLPGCRSVEVVVDPDEADAWRTVDAMRPDPLIRTCVALHRQGRNVRQLRAPRDAVEMLDTAGLDGRLAVVQMRSARAQTTKNSNVSAWMEAADYIASKGYRVIVVPDTDEAVAGVTRPVEQYVPAALDIALRCALYERAEIVLSAGVGPAYFCLLGRGRYVAMVRHAAHTVDELRKPFERAWGIPWGSQLPWAGPGQHVVYRGDDCRSICRAFDAAVA